MPRDLYCKHGVTRCEERRAGLDLSVLFHRCRRAYRPAGVPSENAMDRCTVSLAAGSTGSEPRDLPLGLPAKCYLMAEHASFARAASTVHGRRALSQLRSSFGCATGVLGAKVKRSRRPSHPLIRARTRAKWRWYCSTKADPGRKQSDKVDVGPRSPPEGKGKCRESPRRGSARSYRPTAGAAVRLKRCEKGGLARYPGGSGSIRP